MLEQIATVIGKRDRPMRRQLGPKKPNKLAVSQNPEKIESCKKMRNVDDISNVSVAVSPQAWKSATQNYLERNRNRVATDRTPPILKSYDCLGQEEPGRANNLNVIDSSPIPNVDTSMRRMDTDTQWTFETPNARIEHVQLSLPGENVEMNNLGSSTRRTEPEKLDAPFDNLNALFDPVPLSFPLEEDVKPPQVIVVDGTDITSQIPEPTRTSYFQLCRTRSTLLHSGLSEGILIRHAVIYICETVTIASAIKACNISTPQKEIEYLGKTLDFYSLLGMDVGFMLDRVNKLLDLKTEATKAVDRKRDEEARVKKEGNEAKIKCFQLDIEEMTKKMGRLELEIENLREHNIEIDNEREGIRKLAEKFEVMFKLKANAPW